MSFSNIASKVKIIQVGALPPPYGGITTHLERLRSRSNELEDEGLDVYFLDLFSKHRLLPWKREKQVWNLSCLLKECFYSRTQSEYNHQIFHLHASTGANLAKVCAVLKLLFPSSHLWVTFHHGSLKSAWQKLPKQDLKRLRATLGGITKVICVSHGQIEDVRTLGVSQDKIAVCPSYIQITHPEGLLEESESTPKRRVIGTSGYGKTYYQFNRVVDVVKSIRQQNLDIELQIILYGSIDDDVMSSLQALSKQYSWLKILPSCSSEEFRKWLSSLAIYVRMTLVDSFGLALAEAHEVGTPTIASTVCKRPPGTLLVSAESNQELYENILKLLQSPTSLQIPIVPDGFLVLKELYSEEIERAA